MTSVEARVYEPFDPTPLPMVPEGGLLAHAMIAQLEREPPGTCYIALSMDTHGWIDVELMLRRRDGAFLCVDDQGLTVITDRTQLAAWARHWDDGDPSSRWELAAASVFDGATEDYWGVVPAIRQEIWDRVQADDE
jgi:hypothetical protein